MLITTGKDDDMECADAVVLYAYGSKGMVGPIPIGNGDDFVFQPGNTNEFKVMFMLTWVILLILLSFTK